VCVRVMSVCVVLCNLKKNCAGKNWVEEGCGNPIRLPEVFSPPSSNV
jgi:hypothetical protein